MWDFNLLYKCLGGIKPDVRRPSKCVHDKHCMPHTCTNRTEGYFTAKGKCGEREPRVLLVTQGHGVKKNLWFLMN